MCPIKWTYAGFSFLPNKRLKMPFFFGCSWLCGCSIRIFFSAANNTWLLRKSSVRLLFCCVNTSICRNRLSICLFFSANSCSNIGCKGWLRGWLGWLQGCSVAGCGVSCNPLISIYFTLPITTTNGCNCSCYCKIRR